MNRPLKLYKRFGGLNLLKEYWKTGFILKAPLHIIMYGWSNTSLEILRLCANFQLYNYLKKRYWKYFDKISFPEANNEYETSNIVWVCWLQGIENAPFLVKRCYGSMQKYLKNEKIIVLTEETINNYVTFPDFIIEKYKKGYITKTHLTDLLRLELLSKHGGIWIDATVLCTGEIPYYIKESDFFITRSLKPGRDGKAVPISSWFMVAKRNNKTVIAIRELMYEYWRRNSKLIDYFLIHNFIQLALERFPEEEKKMIKYPNSTPHILLLDAFEAFDKNKWESIKAMSTFHKLSYKIDIKDACKPGTFFDEIINKNTI